MLVSTATDANRGKLTARHLGASTVCGQSLLRAEPTTPFCSIIVDNQVTLMAANGDEVLMQNAAQVCFDPATRISNGTGTCTIIGGTGRFNGLRALGLSA